MSLALVVTDPTLDASGLIEIARVGASEVEAVVLAEPGVDVTLEPQADRTVGLAGAGLEIAEAAAAVLAERVERQGASLVVLPATARFREVAPLLTSRLGAACAPDVIEARRSDGGLAVDRLLFGGVAIATIELQRERVVLTAAVTPRGAGSAPPAPVETAEPPAIPGKQLLSRRAVPRDADLSSASRIVAFGRGLRSKEDIGLIERLCEGLDAQIGCSRPIVEDLAWLPLAHQVGLTGTTVRPDLYVAVGISGQIQHLVGMRDAKVIVAINSNPSAPIFDAADIGVAGDLYEIVPRLIDAIGAPSEA